jgi:hypothetical protein
MFGAELEKLDIHPQGVGHSVLGLKSASARSRLDYMTQR